MTKATYSKTVLKESQIATMEEFIDNVKVLIPTLGYNVLSPAPAPKDDEKRYHCHGAKADATGFLSSGGFTVLKGSIVSDHTTPSMETQAKPYYELRKRLEETKVIVGRAFTKNYEFKSLSAAAAVVLGRSANGRTEWKDK